MTDALGNELKAGDVVLVEMVIDSINGQKAVLGGSMVRYLTELYPADLEKRVPEHAAAEIRRLRSEVQRLKETRIELASDWRQREPPAWLVSNFGPGEFDYRMFYEKADAEDYAESQAELAGLPDGEKWPVYPLYAGVPKREAQS